MINRADHPSVLTVCKRVLRSISVTLPTELYLDFAGGFMRMTLEQPLSSNYCNDNNVIVGAKSTDGGFLNKSTHPCLNTVFLGGGPGEGGG